MPANWVVIHYSTTIATGLTFQQALAFAHAYTAQRPGSVHLVLAQR